MVITKENYKSLKASVEGKRLDQLELAETYPALCYLTHRRADETGYDRDITALQIYTVRKRQSELLAAKGIYVLRG